MSIPTRTVRVTLTRKGWRQWLRHLTLRPTETETWEYDVADTGTYYDAETDRDVTVFGTQPVGPARRIT